MDKKGEKVTSIICIRCGKLLDKNDNLYYDDYPFEDALYNDCQEKMDEQANKCFEQYDKIFQIASKNKCEKDFPKTLLKKQRSRWIPIKQKINDDHQWVCLSCGRKSITKDYSCPNNSCENEDVSMLWKYICFDCKEEE